jgi:hypothetical protein
MELNDFKKEIETKFKKSELATYTFIRKEELIKDSPLEGLEEEETIKELFTYNQ